MIKNLTTKICVFFLVLVADVTPPKASDIDLPTPRYTDVPGLLNGIVDWFIGFAGALALIAIVYSGIMYITASGDVEKAAKARKNLLWAIYGILIIFGIYAIFKLINDLLLGA